MIRPSRLGLAGALIASMAWAQAPADVERLETVPLSGLRGPVAALLATGVAGGDLPAAARAWRREHRGDFFVDVLGGAAFESAVHELEVYAYAADADGRVHEFLARSVIGEEPLNQGVRFMGSVGVADTASTLRLLVVEPSSLRYRLLLVPFEDQVDKPIVESVTAFRLPEAERLETERPEASVEVEPETPETRRKRKLLRALEAKVRRGYLAALSRLASGVSPPRVASTLAEVGTKAFELDSALAGVASQRVVAEMADELSKDDAEVLLPMALLHLELFQYFVDREAFHLADTARKTTSALAESFASRSSSPQAGRLAARILLSLAVTTTLSDERRRLLEVANGLAADDAAVGLATATAYERNGRYEEAVVLLADLRRRNPGHSEVRLRLALNLGRVGRADEARAHLEGLLTERVPDWILALTYQELARMHWRDGRAEEAVRLLRRGVERLPEASRLVLQLSWMLDRQGFSARAREMVASIGAGGESPRHRYGNALAGDHSELRRGLVEQSRLRVVALQRALQR